MDQNPQPHGAHIFHRRFWRVTVLTSMLFRIEFDPAELFEDRMSQIVTGRSFAKHHTLFPRRMGAFRYPLRTQQSG